jgi:hypothetical protein
VTVRSELLALQDRARDHILHVEEVWSWAKSHTRSALHRSIEWDVDKAAKEYQFWQIRRLIAVHIVVPDGTPQIVSLSIDRVEGGGYRRVSDVLQNRALSEIMLKDALADLERVRLRYSKVKELTDVWAAVDKVRTRANARAKSPARRRA